MFITMATWKAFVVLAANGLVQLTWVKQVNSDLDLIWQKGAPDGNVRMNSKFPGLELHIDQGDNVEYGTYLYHVHALKLQVTIQTKNVA
ncbi:hypothetical protein E8E15_008653 [Penicillium rubens]|nr:hypothetical protein E8E15_008653 [Penicillium rubens]